MATIQTSIKLNDHFSSALRSMNNALNMAISNFESVNKASNKAVDTSKWKAVRSEIAKSNAALGMMDDEINKAVAAQNRLNNSMRNGGGMAQGLWGKIKTLGAAYAGWQTAQAAIGASDKYANNTARLGLITGGDKETADLQQKIYEASQRSLTNYTAMTDAVAKLGITAKNAFNNNDEIVAFTELLNKQFKIAGTGAQEQAAAMYQLTQAMAAGKLQGDEFRSILENAPMLAQSIAKEMGVTPAILKEMSSEGKITADVIKNALFNSAEEVNEAYKKLPMTFGSLWTQVVNKINKGSETLYKRLGQIWNNPAVQQFVDSMVNGFLMVVNVVVELFNVLAQVFSFIYRNWDIIEPILIGLAIVYIPTMIRGLWAMVQPILVQAAAWLAMNWPILLIAAAIAGLIWLLNYFGITGAQVCGYVCGAFMWLVASVWNGLKLIGNMAWGCAEWIVNAFTWVADNFSTIFYNIGVWWDNLWIDARVGFYSFINDVLSKLASLAAKIQPIAKLLDIDLSGMVGNAQASITGKIDGLNSSRRQAKGYSKMQGANWEHFAYTDMNAAFDKGYNWGSGMADKVGDFASSIGDKFSFGGTDALTGGLGTGTLSPIGSAMKNANSPLLDQLKGINKNTSQTSSNTAKSNVDMSYLRELAERDAINNISNSNVKVDMTNNNSVNSMLDLDSVVNHLYKRVSNAMNTSAEGVHI